MNLIYPALLLLIKLARSQKPATIDSSSSFQVEYQWTVINFTWPSERAYKKAIKTQSYIPENNPISGIKFYKDRLYITVPRVRAGAPVTLASIPTGPNALKTNPLLTPFPDWKTNNPKTKCQNKLENVESMEIGTDGIMWVLDGTRILPDAKCPPKLVLYDLNQKGKVVETFTFPDEICAKKGGFLNDIVLDESDGGFAYITDTNVVDPGLIVYSRKQKYAWKIRDASMFPEIRAWDYKVDGVRFLELLAPVDGIALSPAGTQSRNVYYCALTGFSLYSLSTDVLKNETTCSGNEWRFQVKFVGKKQAQSDGMIIDNKGNFYYGLLPLYAVAKWNINKIFSTAAIVGQNRTTMIWIDSFAFDNKGSVYFTADQINKYADPTYKLEQTDEVKFRILKLSTSTKSYLYS